MRDKESFSKSRRSFSKGLALAGFGWVMRPGEALGESGRYDVRAFGAKGDGQSLDTAAIQKAIDSAASNDGGVVWFPSGTYLSFSLKLRSNITLQLSSGATLLAATATFRNGQQYDLPEEQPTAIVPFQDYGHNHWHNSLIWGENIRDVAVLGPGVLWGRGLNKGDGPAEEKPGAGNKMIALKNCHNVLLRDIEMRDAGHFGVLASGVDNLIIDGLKIDTRRDGIDIDSCRDVHVSNCTVNSPWDDGIVLKSSYSLGKLQPTERVTITNCVVTGSFQVGSMLDGTFLPFPEHVPVDPPAHTGRIKIGTETNGDVRNVVVSNCVLDGCFGLAVESEDGGHIEDISFSNITMRNLTGPPFFVRLGSRLRGPAGTATGSIRRVAFADIQCWNADARYCSMLTGVLGAKLEDISFMDIHVEHRGGGNIRHNEIPEREKEYPDPQMFGAGAAHGFFVRHVQGLRMGNIAVKAMNSDERPLMVLDDVQRSWVHGLEAIGSTSDEVQGRRLEQVQVLDASLQQQTIVPYEPK